MKKLLLFISLLFISSLLFGQKIENSSSAFFYENKGQIIDQKGKENSAVQYLFHSNGLNVQLKNEGFSYDVYEVKKSLNKKNKHHKKSISNREKNAPDYDLNYQFHRVDIDFVGANKNSQIIAEGKSTDYDNYYNLPNKPEGVTNVHRFEKVTYKNLYSNIDLVFFKPEDISKPVEYNFIINPGGRISDIKMKFSGAKTRLKKGKLSTKLRFGEMQENIPHSWEEDQAGKASIEVQFKNLGSETFGFNSLKNTSDNVMVIDPVPTRIWGSFNNHTIGGSVENFIKSSKNSDFVYESSQIANARNLATTGTFMTNTVLGIEYGYVIKFGHKGVKIWGTFIGNSNPTTYNDGNGGKIWDGVIDSNDNLYVVGSVWNKFSTSNSITTPGTFMQNGTANDREAFILKLNPSGQRIWGTYFGGSDTDEILCVDIDSNENIIFGGKTLSTNNISTSNAEIPLYSINNLDVGFWGKMDQNGQLIYSTYFYAPVSQIRNDISDNIYIGGRYKKGLNLPNFTTPGVHQENLLGIENAFIIKFDSNHIKKWGTFYGGKNFKNGSIYGRLNDLIKIGTDLNLNVYIMGNTTAMDNISTPGALKEITQGSGSDIFIAKLDSLGKRIWGTYYGADTDYDDYINDAKIINNGEIYLTGRTWNPIGIIPPLNIDYGRVGGFVTKFLNNGTIDFAFLYNKEFRLSASEIRKIDVKNDNIFVSGVGDNPTYFSTPGAYQQTGATVAFGGKFVAKFGACPSNPTVSSNSQICINDEINLNASGGNSYSWTGPNGFSSILQNPTILNATILNTGIYSCTISGTGGCDGTYTVEVKVEDKTAPIPDVANLPTITGNCKTVITTFPTATDNCAGNIVGTTSDPLQYSVPGNYVIHWTYDDGNGNVSTQNQNVIITSEPLPSGNSIQNFCLIDHPKISDIQISETPIKWYDAAGNSLDPNTLLVDGTSYFATQTLNGCESAQKEILVNVNDPNAPTGNATQDFCSAQNPTISNIILIEQNVKWYNGIGTLLPITTPLVDGKTYYATQTVNGCESTQKIAVTVSITNGGIQAKDFSTPFCNDTTANTKADNLNNYKGNLITNPTNYIFEFFDANNQVVPNPANVNLNIGTNLFNVKVSNSLGCFVFVKLTLTLNPKPILNLPIDVEFCNGQSATLDAGSGYFSYEWSKDNSPTVISTDQILVVSEAGKYSVKVKNSFGCENVSSVNVTQSVIATIVGIQIVNNTSTVQMSDAGDFEYSLDNIKWQDSNVFKNLNNGSYTVFVKTKLGCIIGSMNFSIFNISNVFTPNADGSNDTWKISGMENYPGSEIQVFDRFGDVVFQKITNGTFEWNGYSNSRVLPTGNYWYVVKVSDGRLLNGWVLIKNRN